MKKLLIPTVFLKQGKVYLDASCEHGWESAEGMADEKQAAAFYGIHGADAICIFEFSSDDTERERNLKTARALVRESEIPAYVGGSVKRFEDVKKYFYTGAEKVLFFPDERIQESVLEEAAKRFGAERLLFVCPQGAELEPDCKDGLVSGYFLLEEEKRLDWNTKAGLPILLASGVSSREELLQLLEELGDGQVSGISGPLVSDPCFDRIACKNDAKEQGRDMDVFACAIGWQELRKNSDGMVPVVVQDDKTEEVLMLAYMDEEAFLETIRSGRMAYHSRSRNELWVKGLSSGHFQIVKSLTADCDKDTILARVAQIGAACHTGSHTCFFQEIVRKDYQNYRPFRVLEEVYRVIADRKEHPREGSYTNYLFDKGIDKILKKVGEEAAEIIIAAKNPDPEEIQYEIADFLYHVMVLMAEKQITWEDVTRELARR